MPRDDARNDDRKDQRDDLPGPAEDPDTSIIGSTDKRSSENRQKGLEKEQENARKTGNSSRREQE